MKKIFFFTVIAFLTLSSCKKEATTLSQDQTVAESQLQANASSSQSQTNASSSGGAVTFDEVIVDHHNGDQFYNPCTNELMTMYGDVQFRIHGVTNDNTSITTLNASVLGLKAVGESGRAYSITGAGLFKESNYSNGVFTFTVSYTNHFITNGGKNNFILGETYYFKVNADGSTTYLKDPIIRNYCQ
jgi:hypothetical protein